jgi:hypothetical protein
MNIKNRIIIKILCIILLCGLITAIIIHSKTMSDDKCIVRFITKNQKGVQLKEPLILEISILELYKSLSQERCIIKWDSSTGYYRDG